MKSLIVISVRNLYPNLFLFRLLRMVLILSNKRSPFGKSFTLFPLYAPINFLCCVPFMLIYISMPQNKCGGSFLYSSKPLRRRRPKNLVQNAKHVHPLVLESELPSGVCELQDKADGMHSFLVSISTNWANLWFFFINFLYSNFFFWIGLYIV